MSDENTTAEKKPVTTPTQLKSPAGVLVANTLAEWCTLASMVHKSGLAPKHFDSQEKVLVAMQMAAELKIPPITSLRNMYVVNGTPSLWGDLPKSICERSGQMEECSEVWYDVHDKILSKENSNMNEIPERCEVTVKRKGKTAVMRSFSWAEAKAAGLDKKGDTYLKYRKRMLQMRARSWALKDEFSDFLNGVSIYEYDDDASARDVGPSGPEYIAQAPAKKSLSDKINEQREAGIDLTPTASPITKAAEVEIEPEPPFAPVTPEPDKKIYTLEIEVTGSGADSETITIEPEKPKEKTLMQKMAGTLPCDIFPNLKGQIIQEVPEEELVELLSKIEQDSFKNKLSDDVKMFYSNACVFIGRKMDLKNA